MTKQELQDERIAKMIFGSVYPHYVTKVERKDRTLNELNKVITWLTGYDELQIENAIKEKLTFQAVF